MGVFIQQSLSGEKRRGCGDDSAATDPARHGDKAAVVDATHSLLQQGNRKEVESLPIAGA